MYGSRFRNITKNLDTPLVTLTIIASLFGLLMISSAGGGKYVLIQTIAFVLGVVCIGTLIFLGYEYLADISLYLYGAGLILLLLVLIPGLGAVRGGARSWFELGPINFQPAELVKIVFIILYAKELSENDLNINEPRTLGRMLIFLAIPFFLILIQPDLGSAAVFFVIALVMLFTAGISWKYLAAGFGALAVAFPLMWFIVLHDYQKNRILTLFNPELDPAGAGYHVIQSKLAVGSGQFLGSGLFKGASQVNGSLPERHTDFIFSVVCEELGFIGAILVIILLAAIIVRCIYIGQNARDSLGTYICNGVAAMLIFQIFENIGMCIGIFPVTGITLPFFSYGGSSLLTTMIAIGLVLSVKYRCRMINF